MSYIARHMSLLCALTAICISCTPPPVDNSFTWSDSMETLFTFDAQGGTFCSDDGVCIHIPKDAVTAATQLQGRKLPPLKEGVGAVYELELVGVNESLLKQVEIELPVSSDKQQEKLLVAFQEGDIWKAVPTTNGTLNKTRRGTTEHFSQWTLLPEAACQAGVCLKKGCKDGDTQPCYSGPANTKGVGPCQEGTQTCSKGTWGACTGEITPQAETCDGKDSDCNGQVDDVAGGCGACQDGDTQPCYTGPSGTKGVGLCQEGTQTCQNGQWGACIGEITPQTEMCDTKDNDCNGQIDDVTGGCGVCQNGETQPCYSGPAGTKGVGVCQGGTQTCSAGQWGPCSGEITPVAELCDGKDNDCDGQADEDFADKGKACSVGIGECKASGTYGCKADGSGLECSAKASTPATETCDGKDNDCNGMVDDGITCVCNAGETQTCYTGPPGTLGVGRCRQGVRSCQNGQWGSCNATTPTTETCNGVDDDCDGQIDEGLSGCSQQSNCPNNPLPECCNGKDDDCDGQTDEGLQCPTFGSVHFLKEAPDGQNRIFEIGVIKVDPDQNVYIAATSVQTRIEFDTPAGTKKTVPSGINNAFVAKLNPQGKLLWSAEAQQGTKAFFTNLKISATGEVYLRGVFKGTFLASTHSLTVQSNGAALYAKISNSGSWVWLQMRDNDYSIPSYVSGFFHLMDADGQGNVYFIDEISNARTLRKYDATGKLTTLQLSAEELIGVDGADNVHVRQTNGMAKYSPSGQLLWSNTINVRDKRYAFDAQNNIYAIGPNPDIIKVSSQGKLLYQKTLSQLQLRYNTQTLKIAVAPSGEFYIVNTTNPSRQNTNAIKSLTGQIINKKGIQAYVMKFDATGAYQWLQTLNNRPLPYYPAALGEFVYDIAIDKQGRPVTVVKIDVNNDWQPTLKLSGPSIVRWHPHPYTHLTGQCVYGSCKPGEALCQSTCVSLETDTNNCGSCGNSCSKAEVCQSGACVTPTGNCQKTLCNGSCVDIQNDPKNCGGCGLACPASFVCNSGKCAIPDGTCPPHLTKCGNTCVDLQSNFSHCGSCNKACPDPIACKAGQCAGLRTYNCGGSQCSGRCFFDSISGQHFCMACDSNRMGCYDRDGNYSCTPINTSASCGSCGIQCPENWRCVSGRCTQSVAVCKANEQLCANNSCQDLTRTSAHCTGCFVRCPPNTTCGNSMCNKVNPTTQQCNGTTTYTDTDVFHCGACNSPCREGQTCWDGKCNDICPFGFLRCTEQCVDSTNDNFNCGSCGNICPTGQTCQQGTCQCPSGQKLCNGSCMDVSKDPQNCGSCGNVCPANKPLCGGGQCFPQ